VVRLADAFGTMPSHPYRRSMPANDPASLWNQRRRPIAGSSGGGERTPPAPQDSPARAASGG
jgi:hypothetical protein